MKIELVTATEWKRAAIVWAFTTDQQVGGRGKVLKCEQVSVSQFAALEIAGLNAPNTITKYRKAWKLAIEHTGCLLGTSPP